ncbi:hypothetical protein F2Q69_00033507 [Brassica cretica]|uniref:Uncharacterized protein n=1 Tax=Brassica cretica TaxID=69181 RepID=A0A8S9SGI7_BRACR|nr:hypothetical protein F2Q69_00033507 [Brassica cretica]
MLVSQTPWKREGVVDVTEREEISAEGGGVWAKPKVQAWETRSGSANNGPTIDKAHYRD